MVMQVLASDASRSGICLQVEVTPCTGIGTGEEHESPRRDWGFWDAGCFRGHARGIHGSGLGRSPWAGKGKQLRARSAAGVWNQTAPDPPLADL